MQVFAQNLIHVLVMAVAALPFWQGMGPREIALCVAAGLVGGLAQFILVEAARSDTPPPMPPTAVKRLKELGALSSKA